MMIIKEDQKITLSKIVGKNFPNPYWDEENQKIHIPEIYTKNSFVVPEWEIMNTEILDKITETFGLDCNPIDFEDLTNKHKCDIKNKYHKWINSTHNHVTDASGQIPAKREYQDSSDELLKLLNAYHSSGCFYIEDKDTGEVRGVRPPKTYLKMISGPLVPWKVIKIDFLAQRFTDSVHILSLFLNYNSKKNYGLTVRLTTNGLQVDTNDGRHSLLLFGLVGVAYVPLRGPVDDSRTTNMNIFEDFNSVAKRIEMVDELNFKNHRANLTKQQYNNESMIDTKVSRTSNNLKASDRQVYEMFKLLDKFDITVVDPSKGSKHRRSIGEREMFRPDQLIAHLQNAKYSFWSDDGTILKDTYVKDTMQILRRVLFDNDGYFPHEPMMGICQLISMMSNGKPTDAERKKAIKVLTTVLENFYSPVDFGKKATRKQIKDRPYEFYLEVSRLKDRVPEHVVDVVSGDKILNPIHRFSEMKYIEGIIASFLYQLIQDDPAISKPDKNLFTRPFIRYTTKDDEGNSVKKTFYLEDFERKLNSDGSRPLIGMTSFPKKSDKVEIKDYLRVVENA